MSGSTEYFVRCPTCAGSAVIPLPGLAGRAGMEQVCPSCDHGFVPAAGNGLVVIERGRWERVLVAAETGYWWEGKEPGDVDSAY